MKVYQVVQILQHYRNYLSLHQFTGQGISVIFIVKFKDMINGNGE